MSEISAALNPALLDTAGNLTGNAEAVGRIQSLFNRISDRVFDGFSLDEHWPYVPTVLQPLPEGNPDHSAEDWVVIPGVGSHCGKTASELLHSYLPKDRSHAFFDISPHGTAPEELTQRLQNRVEARKTEIQSAYTHSLGFLRFLSAVRHTDVKVGRILADGSPSSRRAIRYYNGINFLIPVLDQFSYEGGLLGKFSISLFKQIERHGFSALNEHIEIAKKDTVTGGHPRRHVRELKEVRVYGKAELLRNPQDFEGKITPNTHIGFCHAEDHARDHSIHIQRSIDEIGEFCDYLGAKFEVFPVPDSNHANTDKSLKAAADAGWFERSAQGLAA